ncbi:MAG: hypothetical protein ABIT08_00125, partial [Bacteroidia bacterium]
MSTGASKFILKIFVLSMPVLILTGTYLLFDPFMVLYHYDNYLPAEDHVARNRDFASTEDFINNYPKYKYDSYIFGNSTSFFYEAKDWQPFINTDTTKIFHFDASAESLYGIHQKFLFLKKRNVPVKNCLIILDYA